MQHDALDPDIVTGYVVVSAGLCYLRRSGLVGCCGVSGRNVTRNWPVCWPHGHRPEVNIQ